MAIPEHQLELWAGQAPTTAAEKTFESNSGALSAYRWPDGVVYDLYMQGSYRNATNVRGDIPVDVVVQLDSTFGYQEAGSTDVLLCSRDATRATYGWREFRDDVLDALTERFGRTRITPGPKGIVVSAPQLSAVVAPSVQYRRYRRTVSPFSDNYVEGMTFFVPGEARWVIGYPALHYANSLNKESTTGGRYKRTVRMFKNARAYMDSRGRMDSRRAPSYFLECVVFNVPDGQFSDSLQTTYLNVVSVLVNTNLRAFLCPDGQRPLFGPGPEQWSEMSALGFAGKLLDLWGK
jgi:hypothetical protein